MTYRTAVLSSFEEYLAFEESPEERASREVRKQRFPHALMLQVSFAELDFANRWCWQSFGPADGECWQHYSEYPVCDRAEPHSHDGKWTGHFFVKTDYDFGFSEWYFASAADLQRFLDYLPQINWGEHYPK